MADAVVTYFETLKAKVAELPEGHEVQVAFMEFCAVYGLHQRKVNEALEQLRVDVKYLAFDLQATRRERDEARGLYD